MKRLLFLFTLTASSLFGAPDSQVLDNWLHTQATVQTWTADFKQTRELKALTEPLVATGKLWFAAPGRFRWEIMKPVPTIAVRAEDELLVIFPRLKRAERYSLTKLRQGQWKDLMGLLDTGFPRSQAEFDQRFHVKEIISVPGGHRLLIDPKSSLVKKYMPELTIDISEPDSMLMATAMKFIDGSVLKNEFSNPQMNPKIDDALFHPQLGPEYKITEPLADAAQ
ncbi:MAG TPA: outer membrane lipoprotein carrier protein LolA [Candidatus Saccharimonadales bacterium]|nr:outer membrane lipoprotein carrier protein LolA [Candidatus Saccharimonadales bacterium]